MDKEDIVSKLLVYFSQEMAEFRSLFGSLGYSYGEKRRTLKSYLNLRRPGPLPDEISKLLDELLEVEANEKAILDVMRLPASSYPKIGFYVGDITLLGVDSVVNPATPSLLGCFVPEHNCIENKIHSAAGPKLRESCSKILLKLGHDGVVGRSYITYGYHLFAKYVIHSIGPTFRSRPTTLEKTLLKNCYKSALNLCLKYGIKTIAFPAIAVGLNGFSSKMAAEIAVNTVEEFINEHDDAPLVIFCVEKDADINAYSSLLE